MLAREEPRIKRGSRFDFTVQSFECQLRLAVKYGLADHIYQLVTESHADINSADYKSHTPLVIAVLQGHPPELIELLCRLGADVNYSTDRLHGYCPLHFAAERNQGGAIEILLEHGALRDPQTFTGCTPLHLAAMHGHVEVVRSLCLNGADVEIQEWYNGFTPLHYAVARDHRTVAELLLEFNASLASAKVDWSRWNKEIFEYLEVLKTEPMVLESICLNVVRKNFLWPNANKNTSKLPLPTNIKRKILLEDYDRL